MRSPHRANEGSGDMGAKIAILNQALVDLGYSERLTWAPGKNGTQDGNGYKESDAATNRNTNLRGLNPADHPATKLPEGATP